MHHWRPTDLNEHEIVLREFLALVVRTLPEEPVDAQFRADIEILC